MLLRVLVARNGAGVGIEELPTGVDDLVDRVPNLVFVSRAACHRSKTSNQRVLSGVRRDIARTINALTRAIGKAGRSSAVHHIAQIIIVVGSRALQWAGFEFEPRP